VPQKFKFDQSELRRQTGIKCRVEQNDARQGQKCCEEDGAGATK